MYVLSACTQKYTQLFTKHSIISKYIKYTYIYLHQPLGRDYQWPELSRITLLNKTGQTGLFQPDIECVDDCLTHMTLRSTNSS